MTGTTFPKTLFGDAQLTGRCENGGNPHYPNFCDSPLSVFREWDGGDWLGGREGEGGQFMKTRGFQKPSVSKYPTFRSI